MLKVNNKFKQCCRCKRKLVVEGNYYLDRRDNKPRSYCKKCSHSACKQYRASDKGKQQKKRIRLKYRQQQLAFVNEVKKRITCQVCNESCVACLDFHHLGDKDGQVTSFGTWTSLILELKKCIVLCCNCHRKWHAGIISIPTVPLTIPENLFGKYIQKPHRVKDYFTLTTTPSLSVTSPYQTCG